MVSKTLLCCKSLKIYFRELILSIIQKYIPFSFETEISHLKLNKAMFEN